MDTFGDAEIEFYVIVTNQLQLLSHLWKLHYVSNYSSHQIS